MIETILLDRLNDKQKSLLTQLSYVNLDLEKFKQLQDIGKVTINDLVQVLSNKDKPYLGSIAEKVTGIKTTSQELLQEMIDNSLGNIEILGLQKDEKSSFFAIAFADTQGNIGMSFRGTDVSNSKDLILDSLTDVNEYITNNSEQIQQALQFYEKYAQKNSSNYLYGHSLGGNLVEHILIKNLSNIKNAFVINPEHISQELLDTPEKINAFNDPRKFSCYVVGGDWVSDLKKFDLFQNNINYVRNNNSLKRNIMSEHAVEAASFNKYGEFDITSREKAFKGHKHTIQRIFTYAMASLGRISKFMYESSSVMIDKMFSRKNRTIKLPENAQTPKEDPYLESLKQSAQNRFLLENFETIDKNFNAEEARKKLAVIHTNIKAENEEKSIEREHSS